MKNEWNLSDQTPWLSSASARQCEALLQPCHNATSIESPGFQVITIPAYRFQI